MTKKIMFLLFISFSLVLAVSCKNATKNDVSTENELSPKTYANKFENPNWIEKYSIYVTNFNDLNEATTFSIKTYNEDVPVDGPKKGIKPSLITIFDFPTLKFERDNGNTIALPELDSIAVTSNKDFTELMTAMNAAESYYDRGDYDDDDYAQGKKYHKQITASIETFNGNMINYLDAINSIEKNLKKFELNRDKKEGLMIRYHVAKTLELGKEAFMLTQVKNIEEYKKTDLKLVDNLIQKLTVSILDSDKLATDKERLTYEFYGSSTADFYYEQYTKQANRMVKNLRELKARIKSKDFSRKSVYISRISTDGLPDSITDTYQELIENYNHLMS